ncbi:MAG: polymerase sigma-54 factor RpoN [Myxococcaceae bacterium]|nr:polymerase sigma-54 factor RpoN [Myxococcaceae bacterium]
MPDASFETLYRVHAPSVQRRARAMLGNDADAWEVVQDVFMSLYERPGQFSELSQLSTFLYSVTTHACLNRIRNGRTRLRLLEARAHEAPMPAKDMPLDPESLSLLHDMLRRLPEPLSTVTLYYYVDDLSHDEIARLVGCSRKHVGNLLDRVAETARSLEATC